MNAIIAINDNIAVAPEASPAEQIDEHVVLIAGHLTGTSRAAAYAYATNGNHIVIASENDRAAGKLVQELRSRDADVQFVHTDIDDEAALRDVVEQTVQRFGHLDVEYRE